jgi:probable rRNA maturation factor
VTNPEHLVDEAPDRGRTVVVLDEQETEPVDADRWRRLAVDALGDLGIDGPFEVTITFVARARIAELHLQHLDLEGPTDVLSFPIDGVELGDAPTGGAPLLLGDIVICPEVAAANAPSHAGTYEDEMALLVVHGLLHLLGRDHATFEERTAMQAEERELLDAHHGPLARDPWTD